MSIKIDQRIKYDLIDVDERQTFLDSYLINDILQKKINIKVNEQKLYLIIPIQENISLDISENTLCIGQNLFKINDKNKIKDSDNKKEIINIFENQEIIFDFGYNFGNIDDNNKIIGIKLENIGEILNQPGFKPSNFIIKFEEIRNPLIVKINYNSDVNLVDDIDYHQDFNLD